MRSKFKWIFTLLLALSMQFSFAQEKTVTGVVSDATGPIPGANVVVRGTAKGTQTDIDGRYSISASAGDVLVFSYVGMADFTATVGASSVVNAKLQSGGGIALDEVVVTGALGIKRKQGSVTYANQVVRAEELTQASNPNVIQSLAGKVAGLQINTTNSAVNATTRITIRAARSITGNNQALIVIDGAISTASQLQSLAPETIESTNIIKGTQGAALYGAQGVNGAIIVTTKRGSKGEKMAVNVTSAIDFTEVAYLPERQTRYGQGWDGQHYAYENGTWGPEFDGSLQPTGLPNADGTYNLLPFSTRGSDNIKDFYKTGTIAQTGVSLSSGDDKGYVFFSANNLTNNFIIEDDVLKRNTFLFRAGKKVGKWDVSGNMTYITSHTSTTNSSLIYDLLQTPTNIDITRYRNAGNEHNFSYYVRNPYWVIDNDRNETRSDIFSGIARVQFDFNSHINVSYNANVRFLQNKSMSYVNAYTDPYSDLGGAQSISSDFATSNDQIRNFYGDLLVNFDYNLTDDINFKLNIGNNIQDALTTSTGVSGSELSIPGLYNISNVSSLVEGSNNYNRTRQTAFFGNLDLAYKNYLFLNATGRYESVSYLNPDNNDFFYPSVGLSFVPTNAFEGLKDSFLSYAKFAASIVKVGRADIGAYVIDRTYRQATGYPFDGVNSYIPNLQTTLAASLVVDPLLKPEFYVTREITANLGFLKNRITLDASYYSGTNTDLITDISSSYASGTARLRTNIGQMDTKGYEVELGLTPFKGDFTWDFRISYAHNESNVVKVTDQTDSAAIYSPYGTYGIYAEVGEEYPIIKGIGYIRDSEGRVIVDANGMPQTTTTPVKLGKATPDYIIGMNTSLDYKGIRLSGVFDYRTGHQYYSGTKQTLSTFGYSVETAENGRTGFIMPNSSYESAPGVFTANTSIITGGTTAASYQSYITGTYNDVNENFILDATAFKVRELSLSYSIPSKMLERTGLDAVRFGVNARNPFTILPKENRNYEDPETSLSNGNIIGLASGTSRSGANGTNQYPATKSYGFSVNLTF